MGIGRLQAVVGLLGVLGVGCSNPIRFACDEHAQCAPDGRCIEPGHCAYPDDDCDEGWAYSPYAGAGLAGECIDPPAVSTSGTTTTGTGATSSSTLSSTNTSSTTAIPPTETDTTPVGTSTTTDGPIDEGLVLWLPLDDDFSGVGGASDLGPLGIDVDCGNNADCPGSIDGVVGTAAEFYGGQLLYIDAEPSLAFDGPFTIALFARDDSDPSADSKTIIAKPRSDGSNIMELLLYASGNGPPRELLAAMQSPDYSEVRVEVETPLFEQWRHLAMVWDGEALELYVDAESVGTMSGPTPSSEPVPLVIGGDLNAGTPDNLWEGSIDDVRIYARALSPADVAAVAGQ